MSDIPRHIAIIMDGNGRWARQRGWARIRGHRAGVDSVRDTTTYCAEIGVAQLTLYAFSTENWKRPQREIDLLFKLLRRFLRREYRTIMDNDIRLTSIGEVAALPASVTDELERVRQASADNQGMVLCLALNYGARQELVRATQALARRVAAGQLTVDAIDEAAIEGELYTTGAPELDLLIRTGGEQRLSNFLLWQASYTEFWYTDDFWPEFRRQHIDAALAAFAGRERRFGDVGASGQPTAPAPREA